MKTKVIYQSSAGRPYQEFDGDSVTADEHHVYVWKKGKCVAALQGQRRGEVGGCAWVVRPKRWKLKLVKE